MRGTRWAWWGAVLLLAGCADQSGPPTQLLVGHGVRERLEQQDAARVVIALRQPSAEAFQEVLAALPSGTLDHIEPYAALGALSADLRAEGLAALAAHPDVAMIGLDVAAHAHLAESSPMIRAEALIDTGVTGRGVVVAVIDTGFNTAHQDLRGDIVAQECFCSSDGGGCCPDGSDRQSGPGAARDDNGHGTNVVGIITGSGGQAPRGIAPDAKIVAIKALDRNGDGNSADILAALEYIMDSQPDVRVVNMSLGLDLSYSGVCDSSDAVTVSLARAIDALYARGTLVFASTGNTGTGDKVAVPACVRHAVAVGAVYDGDIGSVTFGCTDATTRRDQIACFSNASPMVDMLAPGGLITATGRGRAGVSSYIGTSQAVSHAAAAAALLWSAKPALSPQQVENALKRTGVPVQDPRNGETFRRIDVEAALAATP
jgi:subtilisin family serine protease